jgi:glyoxylate/hydroxypyruvate reductase A
MSLPAENNRLWTKKTIALVTRIEPAAELAWKSVLSEHLPDECILSFHEMTAIERQEAEIAIVANPDPAHVAALPNLVWIQSLWAGVERLVGELTGEGPPIVRLMDPELARTMAEAVLAWTYYLQRDMPAYRHQQIKRVWQPLPYRPPGQVTVGLLGLGLLGAAAADRLKGAGFKVKGWSRTPKQIEGVDTCSGESGLEGLLAASDILVCLVPLTPETQGLLNARRLSAMKCGSALINFARGPVVVTADLLAALDAGRLSHVVLDVFEREPLPMDSPLWEHPNLTILPHISAPTDHATAASIVAANIQAYRRSGCLPLTVDRGRGY